MTSFNSSNDQKNFQISESDVTDFGRPQIRKTSSYFNVFKILGAIAMNFDSKSN